MVLVISSRHTVPEVVQADSDEEEEEEVVDDLATEGWTMRAIGAGVPGNSQVWASYLGGRPTAKVVASKPPSC